MLKLQLSHQMKLWNPVWLITPSFSNKNRLPLWSDEYLVTGQLNTPARPTSHQSNPNFYLIIQWNSRKIITWSGTLLTHVDNHRHRLFLVSSLNTLLSHNSLLDWCVLIINIVYTKLFVVKLIVYGIVGEKVTDWDEILFRCFDWLWDLF